MQQLFPYVFKFWTIWLKFLIGIENIFKENKSKVGPAIARVITDTDII